MGKNMVLNLLDKGHQVVVYNRTPEKVREMEKAEEYHRMPILEQARLMRVSSRGKESFEGRIIAALRNQFGIHRVKE